MPGNCLCLHQVQPIHFTQRTYHCRIRPQASTVYIQKISLLSAPGRLQRMILRLQKYNIDVVYKPGSQMYVADHLSRAYLADQGEPSGEFQVFALELEEINLLAQLQKATEQDPIMQSLKNSILIGWPDTREEVSTPIQDYWNYREELTLYKGVLFNNQRIIIPQALRSEVVAKLHSSHQGIDYQVPQGPIQPIWYTGCLSLR